MRNLFLCGSNEQGEDQKKKTKKKHVFSSKISTNSGYRLKIFAIFQEFIGEDKKKVFSSKISTNSGYRFKIFAIFYEFLSVDQKKSFFSQKLYEIRCESTKITKIRALNTNLGAEVESRTQGSRPRPRKQYKSEAKDSLSEERPSRGQGQGHSCKCSSKKSRRKSFSGDLQFIGVPRIFDWGRPKPQIPYAMTSSKIFKRGSFCGTKIS